MKYVFIGIGVIVVVGVVIVAMKHHSGTAMSDMPQSVSRAEGVATGRNMGKIQRTGLSSMSDKPKV